MASLMSRKHLLGIMIGVLLALILLLRGSVHWGHAWHNVGMLALNDYLAFSQPQVGTQAEFALQESLRFMPNDRATWRAIGLVRAKQNRFEVALQAWRSMSQDASELVLRGDRAFAEKQYAEAANWYWQATQIEPVTAVIWHKLGLAYKLQADWPSAISSFTQAIQIDVNNRDSWYELGTAQAARKQWVYAIDAFENGLVGTTGEIGLSDLYYMIGIMQQHLAQEEAAWLAYEQAQHIDDYTVTYLTYKNHRADTYYQQGILLAQQQRWPEAIQRYEQAISLDEDHYWAYLSQSIALWHSGAGEEALVRTQQAIDLRPNQHNGYHLLGDIYYMLGENEKAEMAYDDVLKIDPQWQYHPTGIIGHEE